MLTSASRLRTSLLIGVGIPAALILSAILLPASIPAPVHKVVDLLFVPGDSLIRAIYPWHVPRLSDLVLATLVDIVFYALVTWIALTVPWGRLWKTTGKGSRT